MLQLWFLHRYLIDFMVMLNLTFIRHWLSARDYKGGKTLGVSFFSNFNDHDAESAVSCTFPLKLQSSFAAELMCLVNNLVSLKTVLESTSSPLFTTFILRFEPASENLILISCKTLKFASLHLAKSQGNLKKLLSFLSANFSVLERSCRCMQNNTSWRCSSFLLLSRNELYEST